MNDVTEKETCLLNFGAGVNKKGQLLPSGLYNTATPIVWTSSVGGCDILGLTFSPNRRCASKVPSVLYLRCDVNSYFCCHFGFDFNTVWFCYVLVRMHFCHLIID